VNTKLKMKPEAMIMRHCLGFGDLRVPASEILNPGEGFEN
jgi:hypothetical protein